MQTLASVHMCKRSPIQARGCHAYMHAEVLIVKNQLMVSWCRASNVVCQHDVASRCLACIRDLSVHLLIPRHRHYRNPSVLLHLCNIPCDHTSNTTKYLTDALLIAHANVVNRNPLAIQTNVKNLSTTALLSTHSHGTT